MKYPIVRKVLRKLDIESRRYTNSVPHRRIQVLRHYGVELVLDIGANDGGYARELTANGWTGGILSVEPLPDQYEKLATAADLVRGWRAQRAAVGASAGTIDINVSSDTQYSSVLTPLHAAVQTNVESRVVSTIAAEMTTLDALVDGCGVDPSRVAVKIDVQGYERAVFDGGERALARVPFLEVEVSPLPVYEDQILLPEVIARTGELGLTLALVENVFPNRATGEALQFNGIFTRR